MYPWALTLLSQDPIHLLMSTKTPYVLSDELREAILIAEITGRPLLVKGEPGTGKTLLAQHIADEKGLSLFQWTVKSTTTAKDGLYFYDAVSRLNDARFGDRGDQVANIENYIRLEAMGQALDSSDPSVLLIDEIDKADIEFPNDLLLELDRMEFTISETGRTVRAIRRPLVIITSNNEKELPDAFLRRCVFHYIEFPDHDMMSQIVFAHYPSIDQTLMEKSLKLFYTLRDQNSLKKRPSTSELIDWIAILLHHGGKLESGTGLPFAGALVKNEEDLILLQRKRCF